MSTNLAARGKARDSEGGYIELSDLDYRCSKCGRGEKRGKTMQWDVGIGMYNADLGYAPVYLLCDRCSEEDRLAAEGTAPDTVRSPLA